MGSIKKKNRAFNNRSRKGGMIGQLPAPAQPIRKSRTYQNASQLTDNNILLTDSYKFSHYAQFPVIYKADGVKTKNITKNINDEEKFGAYNVSYFEARGSNMEIGKDNNINWNEVCFFGLQYYIKKYLTEKITTDDVIDMKGFIDQHVTPGMFPEEDWNAILNGSGNNCSIYGPRYGGEQFEMLCDKNLKPEEAKELNAKYKVEAGFLPIRIDAIPEGSRVPVSTPLFKITNTHPRFYWLPNYLETLFVQVWYPMTICTSSFLQRLILNYYTSNMKEPFDGTGNIPPGAKKPLNYGKGLTADFVDLLDFGFRGVSSLETAKLGSMSYMAAGFVGSDTPVGVPTIQKYYKAKPDDVLVEAFIGSSVPASEHSNITSWCKYDDGNSETFQNRERKAWMNELKQYGLKGIADFHSIAFVIDGYNTWNAIKHQFLHDEFLKLLEDFFKTPPPPPQPPMRLIILRPDSGKAHIILPQMAYMLKTEFDKKVSLLDKKLYKNLHAINDAMKIKIDKSNKNDDINGKFPLKTVFEGRIIGFTILQGDSVDPQRLPQYCAAIDNAGFDVRSFRFGSGGGLLQKVNRDTFECAFKCCAMSYPSAPSNECNLTNIPVVKNPITSLKDEDFTNPKTGLHKDNPGGLKKSKAGWLEVDENFNYFDRYTDSADSGKKTILKCVFLNGEVISEYSIGDIRSRIKDSCLKPIGKGVSIPKLNENTTALTEVLARMKETETSNIDPKIPNALAELGSQWYKHPKRIETFKNLIAQQTDNSPPSAVAADAYDEFAAAEAAQQTDNSPPSAATEAAHAAVARFNAPPAAGFWPGSRTPQAPAPGRESMLNTLYHNEGGKKTKKRRQRKKHSRNYKHTITR